MRLLPAWAMSGAAAAPSGPNYTPPKPPAIANWNDKSAQTRGTLTSASQSRSAVVERVRRSGAD